MLKAGINIIKESSNKWLKLFVFVFHATFWNTIKQKSLVTTAIK
jgi:hypothetical protein